MNTTPTGFFAGTDNLDASSKLPYLPPTFSGICRVDLCKGISVRKGGRAFIAELTVLTSNLDHLDPSDSKYVAIGSRRSWYQAIPVVDATTAFQSCIAFLWAALGLDKSKPADLQKIDTEIKPVQSNYLEDAIKPANPLGGAFVHVQTSDITTKKLINGEPGHYTLHNFAPAADPTVAKATA